MLPSLFAPRFSFTHFSSELNLNDPGYKHWFDICPAMSTANSLFRIQSENVYPSQSGHSSVSNQYTSQPQQHYQVQPQQGVYNQPGTSHEAYNAAGYTQSQQPPIAHQHTEQHHSELPPTPPLPQSFSGESLCQIEVCSDFASDENLLMLGLNANHTLCTLPMYISCQMSHMCLGVVTLSLVRLVKAL